MQLRICVCVYAHTCVYVWVQFIHGNKEKSEAGTDLWPLTPDPKVAADSKLQYD